jgi:hypothetical protein
MGVYKFSQAGTLVQPRTSYKSMLAGNPTFVDSNYELIESVFVTSNTASVTFSNLDTYAPEYKHLQIRLVAKNSSTGSSVDLRMNDVTSSVYSAHYLSGSGSSVISQANPATTRIIFQYASSPTATANSFGTAVIDILEAYSTSKKKTVRGLAGRVETTPAVQLAGGLFDSTVSITSLTLSSPASNNFVAGSRFSIYGIKG